ncbi:MAG: ECF-type sigma factor [Acidobacteriota bacterium]
MRPKDQQAKPSAETPGSTDITDLLFAWRRGSEEALHRLMPLVYGELRRIAQAHMHGERSGHTLDPTDLLHQAYPRLLGLDLDWRDRAHFLNMASRTMRRILVEHARARGREKRGGARIQTTLDPDLASPEATDLLDLDAALEALTELDPRKGELLQGHYFGGLTYSELAEVFELSEATVHRELRSAKAFLGRELGASST